MDVGPANWQKKNSGFCLVFLFGVCGLVCVFYIRFTYDSDTTIFEIMVGFEDVLEEKVLTVLLCELLKALLHVVCWSVCISISMFESSS